MLEFSQIMMSFVNNFLESAKLEGEGAWRLPLSPNYAKLLKSRVADLANVGGRAAGSVTAAKFLENFIDAEIPWIHIDIAGVAFSKTMCGQRLDDGIGQGVGGMIGREESHEGIWRRADLWLRHISHNNILVMITRASGVGPICGSGISVIITYYL